jgi:hypothetical protein
MAKRTFATIWQQIEKMHQNLSDGKKTQDETNILINELFKKPDVSNIVSELGQILLLDYENFTEVDFQFIISSEEDNFIRPTRFDSKEKILYCDPLLVLQFADHIRNMGEAIVDADFEKYRKNSFLAELGKLPNKSIIFLLVFQQVAISDGLTHIGLSEIPQEELTNTAYYQTMLWAFSELEKKLYTIRGVNIRTEYSVTWHESEWISV